MLARALLIPACVLLASGVERIARMTASEQELCSALVDAAAPRPETRAALASLAAGAEPAAAFAQGCLAMADERWDLAQRHFERALKAQEGSAVYHFWLARALGEQAERANLLRQASLARRTRAHLERAVQLDPENLDARAGLMQFHQRAPAIVGGNREKAREQATEIRKRNPYRGGLLLASLDRSAGNHATAIAEYERLVAQYPDSIQPKLSVASLHGERKQWDAAFTTLDRLLVAHPTARAAHYAVGRMAAESGQQLARGEAALRRYLAGPPPTAAEPTFANAHWRLGMILEHRGERALARASYDSALRLDPRHEAARKAVERVR